MAEGRLSRWSRLKQKGGADDREETVVTEDREAEAAALSEADKLSASLPGGVQVRNFVPAMAPLAPAPEDDDDHLTRGIGHAEDVDAAAIDPDARVEPPIYDTDEMFAGIDEEEMTEEQQQAVAALPPLDGLTEESDFTPFLQEHVPDFIKRKAMRVLWRANPLFGFRDGLNDYDEDFNVVHKIIDEAFGSYKVGRGHLSEEELQEMMPEEAKRAFDEDEEDEDDMSDLDSDAPETSEDTDISDDSDGADTDEDEDEIVDGEDDPYT